MNDELNRFLASLPPVDAENEKDEPCTLAGNLFCLTEHLRWSEDGQRLHGKFGTTFSIVCVAQNLPSWLAHDDILNFARGQLLFRHSCE